MYRSASVPPPTSSALCLPTPSYHCSHSASVISDLTLHILFRWRILWGPSHGSWWYQWIPSSLHLPFPIYPLTSVSSSFPFVANADSSYDGYWLQFSCFLYKWIAKVNASEWRLRDHNHVMLDAEMLGVPWVFFLQDCNVVTPLPLRE